MKESERLKKRFKYELKNEFLFQYKPLTTSIKALEESEDKIQDQNDVLQQDIKMEYDLREKIQQLENRIQCFKLGFEIMVKTSTDKRDLIKQIQLTLDGLT